MNIVRTPSTLVWTPYHRLAPWRDLLESALAFGSINGAGWTPPLDVFEDEERITVNLELAGLKKDDFDISLDAETLTVSGERKVEGAESRGESFRS